MHTRKEIDNILDNIIELIAKQKDLNKESPETDTELQELFNQIKDLGLEKISPKTSRFKKLIQ